jgi:hypothetical protein
MLANTESKVASLRKVLFPQFILLDLQAALKNFFSFGTSDCDVDGDLFVSSNSEGPDCVACFACKTTRSAYYQGSLGKQKS